MNKSTEVRNSTGTTGSPKQFSDHRDEGQWWEGEEWTEARLELMLRSLGFVL